MMSELTAARRRPDIPFCATCDRLAVRLDAVKIVSMNLILAEIGIGSTNQNPPPGP
jgi:hypothetical protein